MDWKKALAIGCGGCGVLCLLAVVAFVVFAMHAAKTPEDVMVRVEQPSKLAEGEEATMMVVVENHRSNKPFTLTDIDIDDTFLAGFVIIGHEPPSKQSMHVPLVNRQSFTFEASIPPGATERYAFHLRASSAGNYTGEVNVNEGSRSIATPVHALVVAQGTSPNRPTPTQGPPSATSQ